MADISNKWISYESWYLFLNLATHSLSATYDLHGWGAEANCLATPVTLTGDSLSFRFINSPRVRICRHAIKAGTGQNLTKNTIGLNSQIVNKFLRIKPPISKL